MPASASAATITPDTTFDETTAGGTCSLREAVQSADTNTDVGGCTHTGAYGADTVRLAGDEYDLTLAGSSEDANASGDLDVTESLTIKGLGPAETGIDGNGAITSDRVLHALNSGTALVLSGLTVHGGKSSTNGGGVKGEAGTSVQLTGSAVSGNAAFDGAGIFAPTVTLTDSSVSGNTGRDGGGIDSPTVTLTHSSVTGNTGRNGGGISGGATLIDSTVDGNTGVIGGGINGLATLTNSTVSGNTATAGNGGGIDGSATTLTKSSVIGNTASGYGGGIFGPATLIDSTVRRNSTASDGGGLAMTGGGDLSVADSTIAGNDTTGTDHQGGGVYFASTGTLNVTDSTLAGNEATGWGGGLSGATGTASTVNLQNATITRNTANSDGDTNGDGGGIDQAPSVALSLKNTIVAGNFDVGGTNAYPDCNANFGITSQGYNLFGTTTGCQGLTLATGDQDLSGGHPLVGLLGLNGGPTLTSALLAGSPAINKGNPATPGSGGNACAASDQRGVPRSLGGRCDIGAYERVACHGHVVNVVGTNGNDLLAGTSGNDGILGLGGKDTLSGGGGKDGLCGGSGDDTLSGGSGNDFLDGGPGTDRCDGGTGSDAATACETLKNIP